MQHFPRISGSFDPIRVPYLGGRFQGGNFITYLADQNPPFNLSKLLNHDFSPHSQESIARTLQAWLYFGLLSEAMQLNVNEEDFIEVLAEGDKENTFVTTEKLRYYIHQWRDAHESAKTDPLELERRRHRTMQALSISHKVWSAFKAFATIVGPEIELSIQLLGCAIEHAVTCVYEGQSDDGLDTWISPSEVPWRRTRSLFVEERTKKKGWCPSVITQLGQPNKLSLQTFVSMLAPSFSGDPGMHANCKSDDRACEWKNIDERIYKTKHVNGCECSGLDPDAFLRIDEDDLRMILKHGEIPVVSFQPRTEATQAELKVMRYRHELQYTAISHVWADGLGNPRENALPLCQIERIVTFLAKAKDCWTLIPKDPPTQYMDSVWAYDVNAGGSSTSFTAEELNSAPLYFWMDTLCVPPREQDKDLRKAAIKNMRAVYNRANRVLVLDADLLATPGATNSFSAQEKLTRLAASTWVRRYWTLQEALLAKKLLFQFAEGPVQISPPPDDTNNFFLHFFDNEVGYYANNTDFMMRSRMLNYSEHGKVASIWSALKGRSTSHKADELICVATLLDMDLGELLDSDEEKRAGKLWKMYTEFPLGVLCRPAEKLSDPAVPWAFTHIADCETTMPPALVTVTQRNGLLQFWHHGFILLEPLRHTPTSTVSVKIDEHVYFIRQNLKSNNKTWNAVEFTTQTSRLAIVLGQDSPHPIDGCLGALINVRAEDSMGSEVLRGEYLRAVSVIKQGSRFDVSPTSSRGSLEKLDRETIYNGAWVPSAQEWEVCGNGYGE